VLIYLKGLCPRRDLDMRTPNGLGIGHVKRGKAIERVRLMRENLLRVVNTLYRDAVPVDYLNCFASAGIPVESADEEATVRLAAHETVDRGSGEKINLRRRHSPEIPFLDRDHLHVALFLPEGDSDLFLVFGDRDGQSIPRTTRQFGLHLAVRRIDESNLAGRRV